MTVLKGYIILRVQLNKQKTKVVLKMCDALGHSTEKGSKN